MTASYASLRARARRLGWQLRRVKDRGPLPRRYSLTTKPGALFYASDLAFIALLIAEAERGAR